MTLKDIYHSFPYEVELTSVISTNATESDLPGPGRTLGRLYNALGRHLEFFLNYLAERRGLGPAAVTDEMLIRDKRLQEHADELDVPTSCQKYYSAGEAIKQRKDMMKLIKYTKSVSFTILDNVVSFVEN